MRGKNIVCLFVCFTHFKFVFDIMESIQIIIPIKQPWNAVTWQIKEHKRSLQS
uniref:Uncharacterized protein n=1 Tax=Anguilla anguilla TaxID=7936 RepID=A0A0E9UG36_ANGAN